jgi:transposase-like protein
VANLQKRSGPIGEEERAHILDVFRRCDNVSETSRQTGRSKSAVSSVVRAAGEVPSGRALTQKATAATAEDAKARRARLAIMWRRAEEETLSRALPEPGQQYHLIKGTGSGRVIDKKVDAVPADDMKNLLTGAAIASDKAAILEKVDAPKDGQGRGLLEDLVSTLRKERPNG